MKKINEIFYSLQGEGCHTGEAAVFIRFSGCNLSCWFCDTHHQNGIFMTDDEIVAKINSYPAPWIILTGGEPSLWIDEGFIEEIKKKTGKSVAIETNGTHAVPSNIDWVTVSPKKTEDFIDESSMPDRADEVKVVYEGQPLEEYFQLPYVKEHTRFLLQPCYVEDENVYYENISKTIKKILEDPRWKLSMQLHRMLGIK